MPTPCLIQADAQRAAQERARMAAQLASTQQRMAQLEQTAGQDLQRIENQKTRALANLAEQRAAVASKATTQFYDYQSVSNGGW